MWDNVSRIVQSGFYPNQVAASVFEAIRLKKFYILTQLHEIYISIKVLMEDILQERNPTRPHKVKSS